jgi:leucyl aminopeptidase
MRIRIAKSAPSVPDKSNLCVRFTSSKQDANEKDLYISKENGFLDIKKACKRINGKLNGKRALYVDYTDLKKDVQMPVLFTLLKETYRLDKYKTSGKAKLVVYLCCGGKVNAKSMVHRLKSQIIGNILATEPANKLYPEMFCQRVKHLFKKSQVKVSWLNERELALKGLGLIFAVGKGATVKKQPRFLKMELGCSKKNATKTVCLVGKGVIFDSGGYNMKGSAHMFHMKGDKTGGGIVVSLMHYFAALGINKGVRIVGLVPLVENLVSDAAYKVGDVHKAYNGKTVEVLNTDAEGRLILADALAYACDVVKPDLMLDFATLTGWSSRMHCDTSHVYFTTNDKLAARVEKCGLKVGERAVRMPNWPEYAVYTRSDIADYKNANYSCTGSDGFMASLFLMNFIESKYRNSWVHFDVTHNVNGNGMMVCNAAQTGLEMVTDFIA